MTNLCRRRPKGCNLDQVFDVIYGSDRKAARQLLGPTPDIKDSLGETLLHRATREKDVEKLIMFLEIGCHVDATNSDGQTPLHLAIYGGNIETAHILMKSGADVNATCSRIFKAEDNADQNEDVTPLYIALCMKRTTMVDTILQRGARADRCPLLHEAIAQGEEILLEKLIRFGAPIDAEDQDGFSPLMFAIVTKQRKLASLLLRYNADVKKSLRSGQMLTPLACAIHMGMPNNLIKDLLLFGANPCQGLVLKNNRCTAPVCLSLRKGWKYLEYLIFMNCPMTWESELHKPVSSANSDSLFYQHDSVLYVALSQNTKELAKLVPLIESEVEIGQSCFQTKRLICEYLSSTEVRRLADILSYYTTNPPALKTMCRNLIRKVHGIYIHSAISRVLLPKGLKDYILLKEIVK